MLRATFLAPIGVRANSTWRLTAETRASWVEKIAPEAVAVRSSSAKSEPGVPGSMTRALFVASSSTLELTESSRALAAGSKVATKSSEDEMPRMATDRADLLKAFMP
jgi:hypothetical protein